jgi:cell division protein FtsB
MLVATVEPTFVIGVVATLISGGVMAWNAFKKTPAEVESISVASLTATVKTLDAENTRLRNRIADLESERDEDRERIQNLEDAVGRLTDHPTHRARYSSDG